MAGEIDIYSQSVISAIQIADINNPGAIFEIYVLFLSLFSLNSY